MIMPFRNNKIVKFKSYHDNETCSQFLELEVFNIEKLNKTFTKQEIQKVPSTSDKLQSQCKNSLSTEYLKKSRCITKNGT